MHMRAAVTAQLHAAWELHDVELATPAADEILVRVIASGMCHTDLYVRDGYMPFPLPGVLGHEGAGIVEQVGSNVTKVERGDRVVMTYPSCGHCRSCLGGRPTYCPRLQDWILSGSGHRDASMITDNGTSLGSSFMCQSSFAEYALTVERGVVRVPDDAPLELLAPLGCGFQTGAGAVLRSLQVPFGASLAVFGSGAVGAAAVMAAAASGVGQIIAVDIHDGRLKRAREEFGATHTINPQATDPVDAIRDITGGGADYSLWAVGVADVLPAAIDCLNQTGICGLVGIAPLGSKVSTEIHPIVMGKTVRGILGGDSVPDLLIPQLIELYQQGRFPLDSLVEFYDFDAINKAAEDLEAGSVMKPVLKIAS
jgi:aryl-alcohol dehydrogenase